jgi:hypothetical protein
MGQNAGHFKIERNLQPIPKSLNQNYPSPTPKIALQRQILKTNNSHKLGPLKAKNKQKDIAMCVAEWDWMWI